MGLNQQLCDMGMSEHHLFNLDMVKERINRSVNEFDFVMIAEFFEESLVLLADYLCWPLEFVVGVSHNVRKPEIKVRNIFISILSNVTTSIYFMVFETMLVVN